LRLIRKHAPHAKTLLDVGCGTGKHLERLKHHFASSGVDLLPEFVRIARERNPDIPISRGDMTRLGFASRYDVVTCLFSSVGYVRTIANLNKAIASMAQCLEPGGILVVEPWFTPKTWHAGTVNGLFIDDSELKISRIGTSSKVGRQSLSEMHYTVGTPERIIHLVETHRLGLFTETEMRRAFTKAGLRAVHDPIGLTGRGLYIGRKPSAEKKRRGA
jgi:SAM-dependent methyltransferase